MTQTNFITKMYTANPNSWLVKFTTFVIIFKGSFSNKHLQQVHKALL